MIAKTKRITRSLAVTIAATAAVTIAMPAGNAYAINEVPCGNRTDFLKVWSHHAWGPTSVDCYANGGKIAFGNWWVDRISTGNNDIIYHDANGSKVRINRWTDISFPNRPPQVSHFEII
ncbi:beta/gamma crystallin domain-containing protein [Streptomyces sp. NPDC002454]